MAHDPTPDNVLARFYELTEARNRQAREAEQAAVHRRLMNAAGIDHTKLSPHAQRILRWLTEWDEWTTGGLIEILTATRALAREDVIQDHLDRLKRTTAAKPQPEAPTARPNPEGLGL